MDLLIKESSRKVKYRDTIFRFLLPLPAGHYSLAINEPEPFLEFIQLPSYPWMLFQNWIFVFILVNIIYYTTSCLDKKYPWHKVKLKRLLLQIGIGVVLPSVFGLFLAIVFFKINGIDIYETNYLKLEWWFAILFILLVNCYYIISHLLKNQKESVVKESVKELVLLQGSHKVKVAEMDIAVFFHEERLNLAHTFEGEQYYAGCRQFSVF